MVVMSCDYALYDVEAERPDRAVPLHITASFRRVMRPMVTATPCSPCQDCFHDVHDPYRW